MKKHPEKERILNYLLSEGKPDTGTGEHISHCETCKSIYNDFAAILQKSDVSGISPSEGLEERIFNGPHTGESLIEIDRERGTFNRIKLSLAIAAILVMALVFNLVMNRGAEKNITISLKNISGDVLLDNDIILHQTDIHDIHMITTGNESKVDINYEDLFTINLGCNSVFRIEKVDSYKKNEKRDFIFSLLKGIVYSRFKHDKENNRFSFFTPNSKIYSIGTKFILTADNNKTILLLKEGTVKLKSTKPVQGKTAGSEMTATHNKKYIITDVIESDVISDEENLLIKLVENKFSVTAQKGLNAESFSTNIQGEKSCKELQSSISKRAVPRTKNTGSETSDVSDVKEDKRDLRNDLRDIRKGVRSDTKSLKRLMQKR